MTEQIGLDAIWNNSDFLKGQAEYMSAITKANSSTSSFASMTGGAGAMGMIKLGGAIGVGVTIVQGFISAISSGASSVMKFGEDALMAASRVQQLNYIAQILGQKAGYTSDQINGIVDSIRAEGIAMGVANDLVAQFLKGNLDLTKATELAKVAQDSATLANMGSSEALEKLIMGIQTLQPEMLRTAGITVSAEQAYKEYAATIGKSAAELSQAEKKQALLNATIEAGTQIAGAYEASMQTAGKQIGSLQSRLIPDLLATMGAPFQTAFFNAVSGVNKLVIGFTKLFQEGGKLYPLLVNLGAIASIITEGFLGLATAVSDAANGVDTAAQDGFLGAIQNAYNWGVNMVSQFASGMINGAATYILNAIAWIRNTIAKWFSPGSPPLVAANIDAWGTSAMGEWLKGFTKADFSILDSIQGQLKNAFAAMVDLGQIGQGEANQQLKSLTKELMAGLAGGGVSEDFFARLSSGLGEFGVEIADLTRKQLALAEAENQAAQAEKDLADAKKRSSEAGKEVNAETAKYNQMLRSGASKSELEAQKAKINLAKQNQEKAKQDEQTAQDRLDAAKEQRDTLKEQVELQTKLVQQLIELAKLDKEIKEPDGGGGGPGMPELPPGMGGAGEITGITDKMKEAVEEAKAKILASLADMWQKIKTMWGNAITGLGVWWDNLVTWAGETWNKIAAYFGLPSWQEIQMAWQTATAWIAAQVQWLVTTLQTWWDNHGASVLATLQGFWELTKTGFQLWLNTIFETIKFWISLFVQWWNLHSTQVLAIFNTLWEAGKVIFANALEIIGQIFDAFAALFEGDTQAFADAVANIFLIFGETIALIFTTWLDATMQATVLWVQTFGEITQGLVDGLLALWGGFWLLLVTAFQTGWDTITAAAGVALVGLYTLVTGTIDSILSTLDGYVGSFYDWGANLIQGAVDGVLSGVQGLIDAVVSAIEEAIAAAENALGIQSPSKVFAGIGKNTMMGMQQGITDNQDLPMQASSSASIATATAARVPITTGTTNKTLNMNMTNQVSNGMDLAILQNIIRQTVRQEFA